MTRPVGHELDDQARWWHAYQLAENNQADELRRLASWLSDRASSDRAAMEEAVEVIRPLADTGDDYAQKWLAMALRRRYGPHGR